MKKTGSWKNLLLRRTLRLTPGAIVSWSDICWPMGLTLGYCTLLVVFVQCFHSAQGCKHGEHRMVIRHILGCDSPPNIIWRHPWSLEIQWNQQVPGFLTVGAWVGGLLALKLHIIETLIVSKASILLCLYNPMNIVDAQNPAPIGIVAPR